jgi:hypothetical protein
MKRWTGALLAAAGSLLLVVACARERGPREAGTSEPETRTERVALRVDDALLSGNDSFAIIEPAFWTVSIYGSLRDYEADLERFSRPQRLLLALHWYLAEVNNGGHAQFYANSTGIVWPDALAAFEELGIQDGAAILRESIQRMGGAPSRDRDERTRVLERLDPNFDDLDERFYALQERVNLDARMMEYARRQPAAFYFSGTVERTAVGPPSLP